MQEIKQFWQYIQGMVGIQDIKQLWEHANRDCQTDKLCFRKITDDIENCEERLEILKYDKKDKVGKLEELQKIFHQSRKVHERNSQALQELQSSGI